MFGVFKNVFSQIKYVLLGFVIAILVLAFAVWLPNFALIGKLVFTTDLAILEKLVFLLSLFGAIQTNFSVVSAAYTIAIAILFGINIALLVYYIQNRRAEAPNSGAALSIGGLVSGVFGIGCAACGTFILSSLLGVFGAAGVLAYLPFGGEEFGFLGIALLVYSIYWITKKIREPLVCIERE